MLLAVRQREQHVEHRGGEGEVVLRRPTCVVCRHGVRRYVVWRHIVKRSNGNRRLGGARAPDWRVRSAEPALRLTTVSRHTPASRLNG